MMGAFVCVFAADESDAASVNVTPDTDYCGVGKTVKYTITADGSYYFKAELQNSSGRSVGGVSPSSGTTVTSGTKTVTVTAPTNTGDYILDVKFYNSSNDTAETIAEKKVPLKVVDPIKLSFTLKNGGKSDVTISVYFKVNGTKIDDSTQPVTIPANGTKDVTYDYIVRDVNDTRYSLESDNDIISSSISGLGVEKTYYSSDNDYGVITTIAVVALVIMAIVLFFVYRKPVVNKGKPKGRR